MSGAAVAAVTVTAMDRGAALAPVAVSAAAAESAAAAAVAAVLAGARRLAQVLLLPQPLLGVGRLGHCLDPLVVESCCHHSRPVSLCWVVCIAAK